MRDRDVDPRFIRKLGAIYQAMEGIEVPRKRSRTAEGSEGDAGVEEESETALVVSEEMDMCIQRILERMERFTEQVSELLEAGKVMFRDLSTEFEERLINIHREQMEKWQEEIKELRMFDASNEMSRSLLQNAQHHILRNVSDES